MSQLVPIRGARERDANIVADAQGSEDQCRVAERACVWFARVLAGKAVDLLVPWPAGHRGAGDPARDFGLAPSGHESTSL